MAIPIYKDVFFNGINYDYILAVKFDNNHIKKCTIPIKKDISLIEDIIHMVEDESYEVDDIYNRFKRYYVDYGSFEYCLGHSRLSDHYINDIKYPEFDFSFYRKESYLRKDAIKTAKNDVVKNRLQKSFLAWNKRQKIDYSNLCLPYIFAVNYHNAVTNYKIESNYFLYSNEKHGRFKYPRKINEDIDIEIRSNFCYGGASSLVVIITYKGIPILPYSIWVKYFYAGFNEIIRCTRSYRPDRTNWNECIDFVVWFVQNAIDNPDEFVRSTVMQEVENLMTGLESIFTLSDEEMRKKLDVSISNENNLGKYYIGIRSTRMANERDVEYYSISPNEAKLVYRMEKITGALHFLSSLRRLSEIYENITQDINRIKEINVSFYPEIIIAISPVKEQIADMNIKLKPILKNLDNIKRKFNYLDDKLQKLLERTDWNNITEVKERFINRNPQYTKLAKEIDEIDMQISNLKNELNNRESYLKRLEDSKRLIEHYTQNNNINP